MATIEKSLQEYVGELLDGVALLEEAIKSYIDAKNDESISFQPYFDKRFPMLKSNLQGIQQGVELMVKEA